MDSIIYVQIMPYVTCYILYTTWDVIRANLHLKFTSSLSMFILKAIDLFTRVRVCWRPSSTGGCCTQTPTACGAAEAILPKDSSLWPGSCPFPGDSLPWNMNKHIMHSFFLWHNWKHIWSLVQQWFRKGIFKSSVMRNKATKVALLLEIFYSSERLKKLQRIAKAFTRKLMRKFLLNYLLHS